ncbi:MAG: DUF2905 domain-containing protein [Bacteriovoracaceae bacterium]
MNLAPIPKFLIFSGVILIIVGVLWQLGWIQSLRLGKLPGDIALKGENSGFYFPITTCILISIVVSFVTWLFRR